MKKITWNWKKTVTIILGTLGIGTLTSCYGMPIGPDDYDYEDEPGTEQDSEDSGEQTEEAVKYNISDL